LNILVRKDYHCVLSDFGESRELETKMTKGIGTYMWMAPEVVKNQTYTLSSDVFSFGLILFELYTRKLPLREMEDVFKGEIPTIPSNCPGDYSFLYKACCDKDPHSRPNAKQIQVYLEKKY